METKRIRVSGQKDVLLKIPASVLQTAGAENPQIFTDYYDRMLYLKQGENELPAVFADWAVSVLPDVLSYSEDSPMEYTPLANLESQNESDGETVQKPTPKPRRFTGLKED